jgi:predicted alpha/beta superfamily hydrolase
MTLAEDVRPAALEKSPALIPGAAQFDITSQFNARTYRIFVFQPLPPPPPEGYPVITLSDGNVNFFIGAAMGTMFAFSAAPALIVGVGYPSENPLELMFKRTLDLTPPTPIENIRPQPGLPPPLPENFGGAADFHRFLTEELRPAIAARWQVDPGNQTLYGYSLGGLSVLTTLFAHPDAYKTFVAASPSIWWNNRSLLDGEAEFTRRVEAGEVAPRVLITIGALEQDPPKVPPPGYTEADVKTLIAEARMVDNARDLGARLAALKGAGGYVARFHEFAGEDHLTAMPGSIARAMDFALRP